MSLLPNDAEQGPCLQFLAPGLVHTLGNALFRAQGRVQLLQARDAGGLQREQREIQDALDRLGQGLQILRWLSGEPGGAPVQAGILLQRLAECLRVTLREHGLLLECLHSARQSPVAVHGGTFYRSVVTATRVLAMQAPEGCGGTLRLDLFAQEADRVLVRVDLLPDPTLLPFPVDADQCAARAQAEIRDCSVVVTPLRGAPALVVAIPATSEILREPSRSLDATI